MSDPNAEQADDFSGIDPELAAILEKMNAKINEGSASGQVAYLKEGTHYIKLVVPPGRDWSEFYEPYTVIYNGKKSKYFLIDAVIAESTQEGMKDRTKIRHIKTPKSMLQDIIAQLAGGAKLFADKAQVIQVKIYKEGGYTKYSVIAQQRVFNSAGLEYPASSIEEAARSEEERSAQQAENKDTLSLPFATTPSVPDSEW